jgi:(p)ppGpp synthase/HD superfamily hydrolase
VSLEAAIEMAVRAHRGRVDKSGEPYVLHPLRVMFRLREQGHRVEVQAAAVLHDVVEDTPVTLNEIAALSQEVAVLVDAMTRRIVGETKEVYVDFIRRAANNPEARALKIADIEDNMSRLDRLRPEEAAFLAKRYKRALEILMSEDIDD